MKFPTLDLALNMTVKEDQSGKTTNSNKWRLRTNSASSSRFLLFAFKPLTWQVEIFGREITISELFKNLGAWNSETVRSEFSQYDLLDFEVDTYYYNFS